MIFHPVDRDLADPQTELPDIAHEVATDFYDVEQIEEETEGGGSESKIGGGICQDEGRSDNQQRRRVEVDRIRVIEQPLLDVIGRRDTGVELRVIGVWKEISKVDRGEEEPNPKRRRNEESVQQQAA